MSKRNRYTTRRKPAAPSKPRRKLNVTATLQLAIATLNTLSILLAVSGLGS